MTTPPRTKLGERLRGRKVVPAVQVLESRRLLSGDASVVTYPGLARSGRDSLFILGDTYDYHWQDHTIGKSVDWGDGSPVAAIDLQTYGFLARHTYATPGTYFATISSTIRGDGHADFVASGVVKIDVVPEIFVAEDQGPLYLNPGTSAAPLIPAVILTDIDSPLTSLGATIDWGDGSGPGPATISADPFYPISSPYLPSFDPTYNGAVGLVVKSDHTFAATGNYVAHVAIHGPEGVTNIDVPVVVAAGSVYAHPAPDSTGAAGLNQGYVLGTVEVMDHDYNIYKPVPFTSSIDWGDGGAPDTSVAPVVHGGPFQPSNHISVGISGGHKYVEPGDYTATLTVTGADGTVSSTQTHLHVAVETFAITPSDPLDVTQGRSIEFVVGTGLDSVDNRNPARFSGSIDWGDGSTPSFINENGAGVGGFETTADGHLAFKIFAPHTYATPGNYEIKFIVRGDANIDGPILAGGGRTYVAVHTFDAQTVSTSGDTDTPTGGDQLATVTVPGGNAVPGDYTAKIDWGDGSDPRDATISSTQLANDPRTAVSIGGSHLYATAGVYQFKITITNAAGETRVVTGTATVSDQKAEFTVATSPHAQKGHFVIVSRYGHPNSTKKVWVPDTTKAAHPGHRKPPHHHPKALTVAHRSKVKGH